MHCNLIGHALRFYLSGNASALTCALSTTAYLKFFSVCYHYGLAFLYGPCLLIWPLRLICMGYLCILGMYAPCNPASDMHGLSLRVDNVIAVHLHWYSCAFICIYLKDPGVTCWRETPCLMIGCWLFLLYMYIGLCEYVPGPLRCRLEEPGVYIYDLIGSVYNYIYIYFEGPRPFLVKEKPRVI